MNGKESNDLTYKNSDRLQELERKVAEYRQRSLGSLATPHGLQEHSGDRLGRMFYYDAPKVFTLVDDAWTKFAAALRTQITGGNDWPNLQLVATSSPVKWDDPRFGAFYRQEIADLVNEKGGSYRKSGISFAQLYERFITDIFRKPINEAALTKSIEAKSKVDTARREYSKLETDNKLAWRIYDKSQRNNLPPSDWISVEQWYRDSGADDSLRDQREIVLIHWGAFKYWVQEAYGGGETIVKILEKFDPSKQVLVLKPNATSQEAEGKTLVFPYITSPDYAVWLNDARQGNLARITLNLTSNSGSYDYSNTGIGAGVGVLFGFFGILAGGSRQTVMINTMSTEFRLTFSAVMQTFDLRPDSWYDSTVFSLFRNGPFKANSPIEGLYQSGSLFGPNGFINYRPARAIIAYKPILKVRMSTHEYHHFKQVTEASTGFFVGPFAIGVGSYYDVKESVRWNDQNLELELFNAPEIPHLLAFDSEYVSPWIP